MLEQKLKMLLYLDMESPVNLKWLETKCRWSLVLVLRKAIINDLKSFGLMLGHVRFAPVSYDAKQIFIFPPNMSINMKDCTRRIRMMGSDKYIVRKLSSM